MKGIVMEIVREKEEVYNEWGNFPIIIAIAIEVLVFLFILCAIYYYVIDTPKYETIVETGTVVERYFTPNSYNRSEAYYIICKSLQGEITKIEVPMDIYYQFDSGDPVNFRVVKEIKGDKR